MEPVFNYAVHSETSLKLHVVVGYILNQLPSKQTK